MRLNISVLRTLVAVVMAAALAFGSTVKPAAADQAAATRNTIFGIAAAIAIGVTAANVAHKNAVANTVEGYTPDGGTVYGNGLVALPNGQSYYPGNYNQSISCNDGSCVVSGNAYNGNGYYGNGGGYDYGQRWRR